MGGKKESNSLPNLQVCLHLNTFVHELLILQFHENSHRHLVPLSRFPHVLPRAQNIIYPKGIVSIVVKQLIPFLGHLITLYLGQICSESLRSFIYVFTKLF